MLDVTAVVERRIRRLRDTSFFLVLFGVGALLISIWWAIFFFLTALLFWQCAGYYRCLRWNAGAWEVCGLVERRFFMLLTVGALLFFLVYPFAT